MNCLDFAACTAFRFCAHLPLGREQYIVYSLYRCISGATGSRKTNSFSSRLASPRVVIVQCVFGPALSECSTAPRFLLRLYFSFWQLSERRPRARYVERSRREAETGRTGEGGR